MKRLFYTFSLLLVVSIAFTSHGNNSDNDSITNYPPGIGNPTITTDPGVLIGTTRWATRNVAAYGTFAPYPESAGMFFQWGCPQYWSSSDAIVTGWNSANILGTTWYPEYDPCPAGWRLPTSAELVALHNAGSVRATRNSVNGRYFGTYPYRIFLPAAGLRIDRNAMLSGVNTSGSYWSNTYRDSRRAVGLWFNNAGRIRTNYAWGRANGLSVRCVAE